MGLPLGTPTGSHRKYWRKILSCLTGKRKKVTILKYNEHILITYCFPSFGKARWEETVWPLLPELCDQLRKT